MSVCVSNYTFVYPATLIWGLGEIKNPQNRGLQGVKFKYLYFETLFLLFKVRW